ncbi:MAG: hypothetical protein ACJ8CR_01670 [Roseiflexaceae bacterium]
MPSYTRLSCLLLGLVLLLASCSSAVDQGGAAPTPAAPRPTTVPQPEATAAPAPTAVLQATPVPADAGKTFVVPANQGEALPPQALPGAAFDRPDITNELGAFFEQVYRARTIERGVAPRADALRELVDGAYADYTIPLFEREVADANDGKLLAASFSDLNVRLDEWQPAADGSSGTALVSITRTRTAVRTDRQETPQTATYQFRAERRRNGDNGVAWVATDFLNPATKRWISEPVTTPQQAVDAEIQDFFKRFYAARTLKPGAGGKFDIDTTIQLTQLAYRDYTLPLLSAQQSEADAGKLTEVEYTDLKVEVLGYDPRATDHGGIATVQVTRTARVSRPGGAESPQTGTYRFRLHDHHDESGKVYWLAVDFFQPQARRWVSEIAGMAVSVPSAGHG